MWGLALLIGCGCTLTAHAGGPLISDSSESSNWLAPLNPSQWKLPQLRWPTSDRPASARKAADKDPGMMANMSQSLGKTWQKTKETLNPKNLMPAAGNAKPKTRKAEKESVWSGWFAAKEEPQKIETINDFLRQPSPY
ncbi:hypothetical protein [Roseimaritima ulvae]|uniref:hypothetical protein n=1 Tax=Roseimaritima ulvae TaxID=980254 RepID=UPI000835C5CB|nr:hypothetical protein [Roseimaritima ulvae]